MMMVLVVMIVMMVVVMMIVMIMIKALLQWLLVGGMTAPVRPCLRCWPPTFVMIISRILLRFDNAMQLVGNKAVEEAFFWGEQHPAPPGTATLATS